MYEVAVQQGAQAGEVQLSHNTQRLIALDEVGSEDLALALAWDTLAMVRGAALVMIRLRQSDGRRYELRQARPGIPETELEGDPALSVPIRAAQGKVGSISVWAGNDTPLGSADQFALIALSWLGSTAVDRMALREAEDRWQRHKRRLDATFSAAPIGIAHVALDGSFLAVNERFAAITGRTRQALMTDGFQSITHPDDLEDDIAHVQALLDGVNDRYMMEKRYLLPDGSPTWVNLTVALVRDAAGAPEFFVSVIEDLSEVKRAHAAATQDPLTGLFNRRGLLETLPDDLARCHAADWRLALLYIDLDEFKQVNDRFGHSRGDACLAEAGARLKATVGSRGSVGRIGGDEFVVTVPGGSDEEIAGLQARIADAFREVAIAPNWPLTASYGCATSDLENTLSAEALIEAADQAMFRDKRRRRGGRVTS